LGGMEIPISFLGGNRELLYPYLPRKRSVSLEERFPRLWSSFSTRKSFLKGRGDLRGEKKRAQIRLSRVLSEQAEVSQHNNGRGQSSARPLSGRERKGEGICFLHQKGTPSARGKKRRLEAWGGGKKRSVYPSPRRGEGGLPSCALVPKGKKEQFLYQKEKRERGKLSLRTKGNRKKFVLLPRENRRLSHRRRKNKT